MKNLIIRIVLSAALMGNIAIVTHNFVTPRPIIEHKIVKGTHSVPLSWVIWFLLHYSGQDHRPKPDAVN